MTFKFSAFSDRVGGNSGILQLMDDLGSAINSDLEIQMLGGGNPARIPEAEELFRNEMMSIMESDREFENMVGNYDAPQGNAEFIDALATYFRDEDGWDISPDNIAITNGSQASFGILFNLFSGNYADESNKKILLPITPEYIGYEDVGITQKNIFRSVKPTIEQLDNSYFKYKVDFESLKIDESIGAICLSRPTNPTGNVITDNELTQLSGLAKEADIPLILDGAYGLPFPGIIFNQAKAIWDSHIILCLSLSKLGLPGVRTGIIIAHEKVINLIKGSNAIFNLAPGRFGPTLVTRLIKQKQLVSFCKEIITPYYQHRVKETVELIQNTMSDLPVKIHVPEGAIFLWLWFEGLPISSEELYQRLKKRGVLVISGHHFFPGLDEEWQHQHECLRITYAANKSQVEKGINEIADEVRSLYMD